MVSPATQTFTFGDWLKFFLSIVASVTVVTSAFAWAAARYTEITTIPARISTLEASIVSLESSLGKTKPQLIDFQGAGVPSKQVVQRGEIVNFTYLLKRNLNCDTQVFVRFYDHNNHRFSPITKIVPAVKSPVTRTFNIFSVPVVIPSDLPDGVYSYAPEMKPLDCGVYESFIVPLSLPFKVEGTSN